LANIPLEQKKTAAGQSCANKYGQGKIRTEKYPATQRYQQGQEQGQSQYAPNQLFVLIHPAPFW
jgi:hypothetical protein